MREAATQHLSTPLHRVLGDSRLELWSLAPLSPAAIAALLALGPEARDEATALVAEELALARDLGIARPIGVALLARALADLGAALGRRPDRRGT